MKGTPLLSGEKRLSSEELKDEQELRGPEWGEGAAGRGGWAGGAPLGSVRCRHCEGDPEAQQRGGGGGQCTGWGGVFIFAVRKLRPLI